MTMSVPERKSGSEGKEEESEDESEIVEESPCGRWQKRKEQVSQGNVPGVESASLAMDTEEGVEVVWNEVLFFDKKVFKAQEKIKEMFENLMQVEHPNIVKFHKYWLDMKESQARQVIFITEYMSSGSLKQFLKKTKKNHKTMNVKAWKRWCTQILSALYLHSCDPPIIHGNLTCDTIFIQHNGLIKIGSWHRLFVNFPDASVQGKGRQHRDEQRNLHFFAPEYGGEDDYAIDIFSFGICALEMAVLEIQANGDCVVSKEVIANAGQSLEDPLMRQEFTQSCLRHEAKLRPTAHDLLFHRVLFEVHSLKLLAAHCLINNQNCVEEKTKSFDPNAIMAEIKHEDRQGVQLYSHVSPLELDKFLEDVNGIYPLMNFASSRPHPVPRAMSLSQEQVETVKTPTPEPQETETRKMHCNLESNEEGTKTHQLSLFLKMEDKLHRQLSCDILPDTSKDLANELVHYAFINEEDSEKVAGFLEDAI
uniref:Nuclear receptor-binding protein 2 n=1 Tax=Mola mola TaxID=94237 RepID=A0A3Q3W9I0_MOLML